MFPITFNHAKATMQSSKAKLSPEHRPSSTLDAKTVDVPVPASSPQKPFALNSRAEPPPRFMSGVDAHDPGHVGQAAQTSIPQFKPVASTTPDARKRLHEDVTTASSMASGTKRARDGKDGPEGKLAEPGQQDRKKSSAKPRSKAVESSDDNDAESASQNPSKRARKGSKSVKSDKVHRRKPADDSASQAEAHAPRSNTIPTLALSSQGATPDATPASPTSWKHGAQSPRANAANRASITLSPRRNSNASTIERTSPARQAESPLVDKPIASGASSITPALPSDDFTFSACDLDTEGVIRAVSAPTTQGGGGQTAPVSAPSTESVRGPGQGGASPGRQAVPAQPGLSKDLTALMDDLDGLLESEIKM